MMHLESPQIEQGEQEQERRQQKGRRIERHDLIPHCGCWLLTKALTKCSVFMIRYSIQLLQTSLGCIYYRLVTDGGSEEDFFTSCWNLSMVGVNFVRLLLFAVTMKPHS